MDGGHDVVAAFFDEHGCDFPRDLVVTVSLLFFKADANLFSLYHGDAVGIFSKGKADMFSFFSLAKPFDVVIFPGQVIGRGYDIFRTR